MTGLGGFQAKSVGKNLKIKIIAGREKALDIKRIHTVSLLLQDTVLTAGETAVVRAVRYPPGPTSTVLIFS